MQMLEPLKTKTMLTKSRRIPHKIMIKMKRAPSFQARLQVKIHLNKMRKRRRLPVQQVRNLLSSRLPCMETQETMLNINKSRNGRRALIEAADIEVVVATEVEVTTTEIREEATRITIEAVRSGKIALNHMLEEKDSTVIQTHILMKVLLLLEMTRIPTITSV